MDSRKHTQERSSCSAIPTEGSGDGNLSEKILPKPSQRSSAENTFLRAAPSANRFHTILNHNSPQTPVDADRSRLQSRITYEDCQLNIAT
jgi:hypothetical protein